MHDYTWTKSTELVFDFTHSSDECRSYLDSSEVKKDKQTNIVCRIQDIEK